MIESCLPTVSSASCLPTVYPVSSPSETFDFLDATLSYELKEALSNPESVGGNSTTGSIASTSSVINNHNDNNSSSSNNMDSTVEVLSDDDEEDDDDCPHLGEHDATTLLCELIGARNLRILHHEMDDLLGTTIDPTALKPYCVVKFDDRRIHRTAASQYVGCNPIWVPSTKSLFLLETTPHEMSHSYMTISIFSRTESALPVSLLQTHNTFLGQVTIDSSMILAHCDEERFEVDIEDEVGEETTHLGKLALRFRMASASDIRVVRFFNQRCVASSFDESQRELLDFMLDSATMPSTGSNPQKKLFPITASRTVAPIVTETDETEIAQSGFVNALSNVFSRRTTRDNVTGAKKIRIKPGPDPSRKQETQFLMPHDIKIETRLPSKNWIEAGSGTLGKLSGTFMSFVGSCFEGSNFLIDRDFSRFS
jgi:hypothetical protein